MSAENISSSKVESAALRLHWIVSGILGALALGLYIGWGVRWLDPSVSAPLLNELLHTTPFPGAEYPVWSWLARGLAGLNPASFPLTLNLFSALCGAVSVMLMYRLIAANVRTHALGDALPRIAVLAGLTAAAFFLVSTPIWLVSNRAHPASFDLVLLLGSFRLLQLYADSKNIRWLMGFALVYGLGVAELATFILFLPLLGSYALYLIWRSHMLNVRNVVLVVLCGITTASLFFVAAYAYSQLPAAGWRDANSYWDVVSYFAMDRRRLIMSSIPRHGWLLLLIGTLVPWAIALFSQRGGRGWDVSRGMMAFYVLLLGIAWINLFNGPLAPWRVLGLAPLLATPYVLIAATYGLIFGRLGTSFGARARSLRKKSGRLPLLLLYALALIPIGWAGVRNAPIVSRSGSKEVARLAQSILDLSNGRSLWFADGSLEPSIVLEAYRRGVTLDYVNLQQAASFTYRRYAATLFKDPRQQSLALAGLGPVLSQWLPTDNTAVERLALGTRADLWLIEGLEPIPSGILYLGARDKAALDPMKTWKQNVTFWDVLDVALAHFPKTGLRDQYYANALRDQAARVANDLGIFMENTGHPTEAVRAYQKSLALQTNNLSAALNLIVLAGELDEEADTTNAVALLNQTSALDVAPSPRYLAAKFGHLRTRAAANLLVDSPVQSAVRHANPALLEIEALFSKGDAEGALRRLEPILINSPENSEAWILLAILGYRMGQPELVERSLRQMTMANQLWPLVLDIGGRVRLQNGDAAGARELFGRALMLNPNDMQLMLRLMELELQAGNWLTVENLINQILAVQPNNEDANIALGSVLRERKRLDLAESVLRQLTRDRRAPRPLAELAEVLLLREKKDDALLVATEAVIRMPQYARAHEVFGRILMSMGRWDEAGDEIQKARTLDPTSIRAILAQLDCFNAKGDSSAAIALASETLAKKQILTDEQEKALRAAAR